MVGPSVKLPVSPEFPHAEAHIESLLSFVTSSQILQTFTGNVHILDFLTRTPDLYSTILPADWRAWFDDNDIQRILDLLLRDDLSQFYSPDGLPNAGAPPPTLLEFISDVRRHCLITTFKPSPGLPPNPSVSKAVLAGMNPKKEHEVLHFASYIAALLPAVHACTGSSPTHVVDFGSGCGYLGRYLAAAYGTKTIAIENRAHVVHGARRLDVTAKVASKEVGVLRNKKVFKAMGGHKGVRSRMAAGEECPACVAPSDERRPRNEDASAIQYVEHRISDGDLAAVFARVSVPRGVPGRFVVVSLHSCGNLVHHGLRTLTLNPTVSAVAMVGCCYNLATESLGAPTLKLPGLLRGPNARLAASSAAADPHGFPMSRRLRARRHRRPATGDEAEGVGLNITARMMAVQAVANWTDADSDRFFTRHFYRAVLQRALLDLGLVADPSPEPPAGRSPAGTGSSGAGAVPLVVGALAAGCYADFPTYARGAAAKLERNAEYWSAREGEGGKDAERAREAAAGLRGLSDAVLAAYEARFRPRRKDLSVTWSLMAFCAQVSEAVVVGDRYAWLAEQGAVGEAWVESVFDYAVSPRNMAVVGIRKAEA